MRPSNRFERLLSYAPTAVALSLRTCGAARAALSLRACTVHEYRIQNTLRITETQFANEHSSYSTRDIPYCTASSCSDIVSGDAPLKSVVLDLDLDLCTTVYNVQLYRMGMPTPSLTTTTWVA